MAVNKENNGVIILSVNGKPVEAPGVFLTLVQDQPPTLKTSTDDEDDMKRERLRRSFWKNVSIISCSWFMLFMGYYPVSAVQSSLNNEKGLGMAALSAKYGSMAFGNLFTNNYVVDRVGCKWAMSIGMLLYSSYIAANFYPTRFTLVPFGVLSGIGGAAMWMAQGTYMTRISNDYVALNSRLTAEGHSAELSRIKSRVFGLFNFLYFSSNALGNVASSLILPLPGNNNMTESRLEYCGAAYCNENLDLVGHANYTFAANNVTWLLSMSKSVQDTSLKPDKAHVYYLCTFCITSALIGVLMLIFFLDRLPSLGVSEKVTNSDSVFKLLLATVRLWRNPYQLLLIPLGIYNGMDGVFWSAEFTKSFVTCPVGVHYVGFVMVCYGLSSPVFIFVFSWFNKSRWRILPYFLGIAAQLAVMVTMLKWTPRGTDDLLIMFIMSVVWGVGSGVWYPSTYAFISIMFRENMEAAFSNFHLWNNLGSSVSYGWSYGLCVHTKVFLLMGILTFGFICYMCIELHMFFFADKCKMDVTSSSAHLTIIDPTDGKKGGIQQYGSMQMQTTE